ncbi:tyrosine-protein kinase domain-containing protein [Roseicella aquatilis]|uniref:non-specific protein-tyrosine kinase n=1 Tax=Roseicella aquatilis TaxID=2527868 RepID=A0A4R4DBA3_9PROT|nr:tyrosine-protein kinase domain-containing protein [Roseicella aquatilis]TCZ57950.1 polysaccharide biosynthesis tyrosine autokinase [Roseicella aquatilis]
MLHRTVESRPAADERPGPRPPGSAAAPIEPDGTTITALLAVLRRRRWVLMLCILLFPLLAWTAAWQMTPRYTAAATVMFEPADHAARDPQGILRDETTAGAVLASQVEAIRSLSVARRIVRQFDLTNNAEFAPWAGEARRAEGPAQRWRTVLARRLHGLSPALAAMVAPEPPAGRPPEERAEIAVAEAVRDRLLVQVMRNSRVLSIGFTSENPRLAADAANLAAELAISDLLETKFNALRRANDWLDARIAQMRQELGRTEARIADLRGHAGPPRSVGTARAAEQAGRTSDERAGTRSQLAAAEMAALEREAEASRILLRALIDRAQQSVAQAAVERPDARILSPATLPGSPSFPPTLAMAGGAAGLGLLCGLLLIWGLEWADSTLRSGEEVRTALGLPCLALVPMLPPGLLGRYRVEEYVVRKPLSPFAESLRRLRAALWPGAEPPRVVVITAARPGEGKTTTAVALARSAAMNGERVLLVDGDVRQPSLGRVFRCEGAPGMTDLLLGQAVLERIIRRDHLTSLDYIPAGAAEIDSLGLLMSEAMAGLLDRVRHDYDLVVLEAPPTLAMADARVVAWLADATLLCVRWRDTPRSVVRTSLALLEEAHARVVGAALTQVDAREHGRSGPADADVHHPRYGGYFRE